MTDNPPNYIIEIATSDFETTKAAVLGGADRIELCADLYQGGTTPSLGTIKKCRESFDLPLFPIIRPRGGDFLYNNEEFEIMMHDIELCRQIGCDGIVVGCLKKDGTIPLKKTAMLLKAAYPMEVTFHRAFDRSKDPLVRLEELISLGVQRILTSGQKPAAPDGIDLIAELVRSANERIIIMPGSGVRKENIKKLAVETGAVEFHSSLRATISSKMDFKHPSFSSENSNPYINPMEVSDLRAALMN